MKQYTSADFVEAIKRYNSRSEKPFALKAALIDMDGVLYDSMKNHTKGWHKLATGLGIECTRDEFYLYEGMTGEGIINLVHKRQFGVGVSHERAMELYALKSQYFIEAGAAEPMPGADVVMNALRDAQISRVLVTGSGQKSLLQSLAVDYPGIFSDDAKVTAADVTHGKPDPEPYLKGQQKAHAQPWQCIVIENAPLGVTAGHRSGSFVIGVTTGPIPAEKMWEAGADLVFNSMPHFAQHAAKLIQLLSSTSL